MGLVGLGIALDLGLLQRMLTGGAYYYYYYYYYYYDYYYYCSPHPRNRSFKLLEPVSQMGGCLVLQPITNLVRQ